MSIMSEFASSVTDRAKAGIRTIMSLSTITIHHDENGRYAENKKAHYEKQVSAW